MTGTTNKDINDLLNLLNVSSSNFNITDNILRSNSIIENTIKTNGGAVIYSFNNIIIASEINDQLFSQLQSDPNIEFISDLPLKKFGDINNSLIDQLDISKLYISSSGVTSDLTSGSISGKSRAPVNQNIQNNIPGVPSLQGISPTILNIDLELSASTNQIVDYYMFVDGTTPIIFNFVKPSNFVGQISIKNNALSISATNPGVYNITIKAINNFGTHSKNITLNIFESVKITNTNLKVYNKIGSKFYYNIDSIGTPPLVYSVSNLPAGFTLINNVISGITLSGESYFITLIVSGKTSSDSKILNANFGSPPIITSSGSITSEQYTGVTYTITSLNSDDTTYNIIGILPTGLEFDGKIISGIPIYSGLSTLKMRAINSYGEVMKDLNITITQIKI